MAILVVKLFCQHCVISVRIRSFSGPYFPVFRLNTERYGVSLRSQFECGKIQARKTSNTYTFHTVLVTLTLSDSFANLRVIKKPF